MNRNVLAGIVVAGLAVVYVGLSWLTGMATHSRLSAWEEQVVRESGIGQVLKIEERKTTQGIFRSTEEITLVMNTEAFDAAKTAAEANVGAEEQAAAEAGEMAMDERAAEMGDETAVASDATGDMATEAASGLPTAAGTPWRVTIRNEILHGPLPGFRSIGLARIESRLVLDEATAADLKKTLNVTDPVTAVTRVGLLGGASTKISSPAFSFDAKGEQVSWKGIEAELDVGRNANSIECDAKAPGMTVQNDGKQSAVMEEIALTCDVDRVFDELYEGEASFTVRKLVFTDDEPTGKHVQVDNLNYSVISDADGDFYGLALKLGVAGLAVEKFTVQDVAYNVALSHLHGPTLAELSRRIKEMTASMSITDPTAAMAMAGAFAEHMPVLLEHSPELVVDRIGFRMPEGEFGIKGKLTVKDFKREELAAVSQNPMVLLTKLDAGFDIWVSEALLNKDWSAMSGGNADGEEVSSGSSDAAQMQQQVAAMEQAGYVRRNGGRFESRIEFRNGALTANGKPLGPMGN